MVGVIGFGGSGDGEVRDEAISRGKRDVQVVLVLCWWVFGLSSSEAFITDWHLFPRKFSSRLFVSLDY